MRITNSGLIRDLLGSLTKSRELNEVAIQQLTDGKRVRTASDDPLSASSALRARAEFVRNQGRARSEQSSQLQLEAAEGYLSQAVNLITSAKSKAIAGASDIADRESIAQEIEGIRDQILSISNSRYDNKYIFGGTETLDPPFDASGAYAGNNDNSRAQLFSGSTVATTFDGSAVFNNGSSLIADLDALATALRSDDTAGIQASVDVLDGQLENVFAARSTLGTNINAVRDSLVSLGLEQDTLQERISKLEDIPLEEAVVRLAQTETTLNAASATLVRSIGRSLFDFFA